jgi:hypothetical protein
LSHVLGVLLTAFRAKLPLHQAAGRNRALHRVSWGLDTCRHSQAATPALQPIVSLNRFPGSLQRHTMGASHRPSGTSATSSYRRIPAVTLAHSANPADGRRERHMWGHRPQPLSSGAFFVQIDTNQLRTDVEQCANMGRKLNQLCAWGHLRNGDAASCPTPMPLAAAAVTLNPVSRNRELPMLGKTARVNKNAPHAHNIDNYRCECANVCKNAPSPRGHVPATRGKLRLGQCPTPTASALRHVRAAATRTATF